MYGCVEGGNLYGALALELLGSLSPSGGEVLAMAAPGSVEGYDDEVFSAEDLKKENKVRIKMIKNKKTTYHFVKVGIGNFNDVLGFKT